MMALGSGGAMKQDVWGQQRSSWPAPWSVHILACCSGDSVQFARGLGPPSSIGSPPRGAGAGVRPAPNPTVIHSSAVPTGRAKEHPVARRRSNSNNDVRPLKSVEVRQARESQRHAVLSACADGDLMAAKSALFRGCVAPRVAAAVQDERGLGALHFACASGNLELVRLLCEPPYELDPAAVASESNPDQVPVVLAACYGHLEALAYLSETHRALQETSAPKDWTSWDSLLPQIRRDESSSSVAAGADQLVVSPPSPLRPHLPEEAETVSSHQHSRTEPRDAAPEEAWRRRLKVRKWLMEYFGVPTPDDVLPEPTLLRELPSSLPAEFVEEERCDKQGNTLKKIVDVVSASLIPTRYTNGTASERMSGLVRSFALSTAVATASQRLKKSLRGKRTEDEGDTVKQQSPRKGKRKKKHGKHGKKSQAACEQNRESGDNDPSSVDPGSKQEEASGVDGLGNTKVTLDHVNGVSDSVTLRERRGMTNLEVTTVFNTLSSAGTGNASNHDKAKGGTGDAPDSSEVNSPPSPTDRRGCCFGCRTAAERR